jgi:ribosomal protein S6
MKRYELMVVFRADFPIDDEKKTHAFLTKLTGGAAVTQVSVLGKKRLAYPIKKMGVPGMQKEGVYVLATIESDRIQVGTIEKEASFGNDVLRYLLTARKGK